eukprot:TRINITY_DN66396_c0_g1_i1.p1 TRINITY_DN66396_c0_g1~~TRINITY_DN66396_c0_g1_i1.p1  ORF type:complete len:236 (+),score=27.13 TRINITY_DN66396_c0_g1_i1:77-784(+)
MTFQISRILRAGFAKIRSGPGKGHSQQWIQRHATDPWVQRAQQDMYRSRAAYKLKQLDSQFSLFTRRSVVVDLGCYAGGWSQVALQRTGAGVGRAQGMVIGVDKIEMEPLENHHFVHGDITDAKTVKKVHDILMGQQASAVISDMAPQMCGDRITDHLASVDLSRAALRFALSVLKEGGWLVVKVFQGGMLDRYKAELLQYFGKVRHAKPKACRQESVEIYLVCSDFLGNGDSQR